MVHVLLILELVVRHSITISDMDLLLLTAISFRLSINSESSFSWMGTLLPLNCERVEAGSRGAARRGVAVSILVVTGDGSGALGDSGRGSSSPKVLE